MCLIRMQSYDFSCETAKETALKLLISFAARLIVCMQLGQAAIAPLYRLTFYHNNIRPDQA